MLCLLPQMPPKRNALNRCKRGMTPLSKELAGLILQHNHFGTHLNENGETVDEALELENFDHAGRTLAEVWSNIAFDGHPCLQKKYKEEVPYDYLNPALSTETLKKRMCVMCNLMFAAINMMETHQKWCTKKPRRTDDITRVIEESEASTSI